MSTRATILAAVARDLGWHTGSISSGTAAGVVIDQTFGDDAALVGWTIIMPDAANEADKERLVTYWDDSARTATWINSRTDTTYTSETYFLVPPGDYTRADIYSAINDCLGHTRYTVKTALPTMQDETVYRLGRLSWLRSMDDVDGVFLSTSPNLVDNSQFDYWGSGASAAPTSWTLAGSGATVARATAGAVRGYYGVTVTRVGADTTLTQSVGLLNGQLLGQTVTASCYARATVASRVRIGISDGLTTTYSSYHTGGGGDELLSVSKALSASGTALNFIMSVDTGNTSGTFSNFVAQEGSAVDAQLTSTGDAAYRLQHYARARVRQIGDQIAVELPAPESRRRKLVVWSAQMYPSLSADTDSTLCPDDVLVPGTVYELTSRMQKGQDRTRIEVLMGRRRSEYLALSRNLREYPPVNTRMPVSVTGA